MKLRDKKILKVLIIEDSDTDAAIAIKALRQNAPSFTCIHTTTFAEGERVLKSNGVDILLLDLGLPDTVSPKDTYMRIKKWAEIIPVIIMTNLDDHEFAKVMVHEGAADFLNKDIILKAPRHLKNAIDFSIERHTAKKRLLLKKSMQKKNQRKKIPSSAALWADILSPINRALTFIKGIPERDR